MINKFKVIEGSTKRTIRAQLNRPQVIYITAFIISKPITFHRMAPQSDFNEVFAHSHVRALDMLEHPSAPIPSTWSILGR